MEAEKTVLEGQLVEKFENAFQTLHTNLVDSFEGMQSQPESKSEIIDLWKKYLRRFVNEATEMSEQYKNKDLLKAITRMFIFGK